MVEDRFRRRARDLTACAQLVKDLTRMPDRATAKDFQQVADLMDGAASAILELLTAKLPGCICRHIETDNYSYLDYAEGCLHHRQLYMFQEVLKADYAKMESALKNELRLKLVTAALTGAALPADHTIPAPEIVVKRAITIADETIRRIV